jgi:aspartate racemase
MKLLGLIGGMAYPSTMEYYMKINDRVNQLKGNWVSAHLLLYSVEFQEIITLIEENRWHDIEIKMLEFAIALQNAGSDAIMICSNTMHKVAPKLEKNINIPIIHVADAVGKAITSKGLRKVGLLGTKSTMEGKFYVDRLKTKFQIETLIPEPENRELINQIIYTELANNLIKSESKRKILYIVNQMREKGAEAIIMGCGEIPMILKAEDTDLLLFNSMELHVDEAVKFLILN